MTHSIKIMKNSMSLMLGRIYHAVLNLFAVALIARYLKVDVFGEYAFISVVCNIFMVVTDMGINRIGIREMSRAHTKANDILWASTFVKFLFSIITFAGIAVTVNILSDNREIISAAYIGALAVIFFFLGDIFVTVFISFEKMGYASVLAFVQISTYLLFTVLFIRLDFGLKGIFGALLISYLARIFLGIFLVSKNFFKLRPSLDFSLCLYLFKEGYPIGIHRILRKTSYGIDTVLIKMMRPMQEVGLYHGVYRIVLVLTLIPDSIVEGLFPMVSRLAVESKECMNKVLEQSFKILLIMVIPLVAGLILFAENVIRLILGEDFLQAVPALMLLSLVWGAMFFSDLFIKFLHASNKQVLATKSVAICLIVTVFMDVILIYAFGYFGAVITTLLAEIILTAITYYFVSKTVGSINWRRVLPKPLIAAVPMIIVMYFLSPISRILTMSTGLVIFLSVLFILKTFEEDEVLIFKKSIEKICRKFGSIYAR